jgi:tRNA uridine 5-carboxymethylaminomethyl modification enzyme
VQPGSPQAQILERNGGISLRREYSLADLIKRPEIDFAALRDFLPDGETIDASVALQIDVDARYSGYIERQQADIERLQRHENTAIPETIDFSSVPGLSNEVRQKLTEVQPATLAQASRLPGVTPAALSLLLIHLKKLGAKDRKIA